MQKLAINLIKNAAKSFFIIEKNKKYLQVVALTCGSAYFFLNFGRQFSILKLI